MKLTDQDILEFQNLSAKHLGLNLSWKDAQDRAHKFIGMMQIVYRPMTAEDYRAVRPKNENEDYYEPSRPKTP